MNRHHRHRMPFGATLLAAGEQRSADNDGVLFRLYAPSARDVSIVYHDGEDRRVPTIRTADGFHEIVVREAVAGTRYAFDIDGVVAPDPASRFSPDGVHSRSVVVDPLAFTWTDDAWKGRPWSEVVLYELHVGTFTPEGTFAAAIAKLDDLVALGITAIELMPVAQPAGKRNWGYDGVLLYSPAHAYGTPDDLKALVNAAHERNLVVFLDVVYNHFGPEGNYLHGYAPEFYTEKIHTPWGAAIDVEPDDRETVRAFFYENALYWIEEYRFDGLRFDAIDTIYDGPNRRFMHEIADLVAKRVDREIFLVVENDRNEAVLLETGFRAQWNDDVHHAMHVITTRQTDGYYADYASDPVDLFGRALTQGFIYQGQASTYRKGARRGTPSAHLELGSFVTFMQNHDQIGNRPMGNRIATQADDDAMRAMLAVMLLGPNTPLLFMGQEWHASSPFLFFCDFEPELAALVTAGRRSEFGSFAEFSDPQAREKIPDPAIEQTFLDSKLDWTERAREPHAAWLAFYTDLLARRARDIAPRIAGLRGEHANYQRIEGYGLSAGFPLASRERLVLDANLGDVANVGMVERIRSGRTIFATHDVESGPLPPWYVRWALHEA